MQANVVKGQTLEECEEHFPVRFHDAIRRLVEKEQIEFKDGKNYPKAVADALAELPRIGDGAAKNLAVAWSNGELKSLVAVHDGPIRLAIVAELLAEDHPMQTSCLVLSYATYLTDNLSVAQTLPRAKLIKKELKDCPQKTWKVREWFLFAIKTHLLTIGGEAEMAFDSGWQAWREAREGFDVPPAAFYSVRRALRLAKDELWRQGRVGEALGNLEDIIPFDGPVPDFTRFPAFDKEPSGFSGTDRDYAPETPEFVALPEDYQGEKILFRSEQVDQCLRTDPIDDVILEDIHDPFEFSADIHEFAWLALLFGLNKPEADLFNGYKVRPVKRLSANSFDSKLLEVQQTTYFESQVTNWSTSLKFVTRDGGESFELPEGPFDHELMSGHYGVMSVVITSDSYLACMFQSIANMRGPRKLVPFGGSIEYLDFFDFRARTRDSEKKVTLGHFLRKSMARELCEEVMLDEDAILGIQILGHTLDSKKALKPDFFGVSFIDKNWEDIKPFREVLYGGPLEAELIDLSSVDRFQETVLQVDKKWKGRKPKPDDFLHANLFYLREASDLVVDRFHDLHSKKH